MTEMEEDNAFSDDLTVASNNSASWLYLVSDSFKPLQTDGTSADANVSYSGADNNLTVSDYPPMNALGFELQAFLIALYSLTALLALGGNVMVIVVLLLGRRSSRELRLFLVNLALSDIAMAVFSIPFTYTDFMLGRWIFEPLFCPVVLFMQHISVIVSVYTLTAIGVDRYYAIMSPLSFRWTRKRGPHIILVIWLVAALLSSVQFVHGRATPFTWADGTYYDCHENWDERAGKVYTAVIFTVTFLTPMLVLTFTYSSIGWKMWRHTSPGNADIQRDQQQLTAKMKVVKMLATVVLMFAVCWLPIHLMNLILYFDRAAMQPDTAEQEYLYIAAFFSCHWFSMANSFVNPIIYCFMSDNFRVDLRQLMMTCCSPLAEHANRTLTKRSCSFGGSLRSSTVVMSAAAAGTNHLCASSVRRQQRSNGFPSSSTVTVPLRTLAHPGHNANSGAGTSGASIRVPIYA